jgi:hypothetical protein
MLRLFTREMCVGIRKDKRRNRWMVPSLPRFAENLTGFGSVMPGALSGTVRRPAVLRHPAALVSYRCNASSHREIAL